MELTILDKGAKMMPGWKADIEHLAKRVSYRYPRVDRMEGTCPFHETITAHTVEQTFGAGIHSAFRLLDAEIRRAKGVIKVQQALGPRHTPAFLSMRGGRWG